MKRKIVIPIHDNDILKHSNARIAGGGVGALWMKQLDDDDYNTILRQVMQEVKTPFWRGVDDVPYMIEVHDMESVKERPDGTLNYRPLCIIERKNRMPLSVFMKPVRRGDDRFYVFVEATPPSIADTLKEHLGNEYHYLLHEIALRVGLSMCYESRHYDNETVKMLMMVEDHMTYKTDLDIEMFGTRDESIRMVGLTEEDAFADEAEITKSQFDLDDLFFSQHIEPDTMPDTFNEAGDEINKVIPYKDIRPIQEFGKGEWWVEMIRCPNCNQRVKVSLNKAQCPDGVPNVKIACKACKLSFSHL